MPCSRGLTRTTVAFVAVQPVIRSMDESDPQTLSVAFSAIGWHKPPALFQRYLAEQERVKGSPLWPNGKVISLAT